MEELIASIPKGMIWRLETMYGGSYFFIMGHPTRKGNFSSALGTWRGMSDEPATAIRVAMTNYNHAKTTAAA